VGLNGIFNETRELIHTSTNLGMDKSGVREIAKAYGTKDEEGGEERLSEAIVLTRSWVMIFVIAGTLFTIAAAPLLSWATFSNWDYTWHYMLLSPAVGLSTLACGEGVVLRGLHKLKSLAATSVLNVIAGILSTIPLYYFFGMKGVVPALVLLFLVQSLIIISFSYRLYRPQFRYSPEFLKRGKTMLMIGLSFVLSGVVSHGTRLAAQAYLNNAGSLETVGFFTSAYAITVTYAGVVLASLDTDYFPRLTSVFKDYEARLSTVRRQIDVAVPLCFPFSIAILVLMPVIVPLLLSGKFVAMIPMAQIIIASLVYRAIHQPLAFMPLSAGDPKLYFVIQTASCIIYLPLVIIGFHLFDLVGIGLALFLSNFIDFFFVALCTHLRYKVLPSISQFIQLFIYTVVIALTYAATVTLEGWQYWVCGALMIGISTIMAAMSLKTKIKKN
jgi:O-antigen/teichoic acid export membrane protein